MGSKSKSKRDQSQIIQDDEEKILKADKNTIESPQSQNSNGDEDKLSKKVKKSKKSKKESSRKKDIEKTDDSESPKERVLDPKKKKSKKEKKDKKIKDKTPEQNEAPLVQETPRLQEIKAKGPGLTSNTDQKEENLSQNEAAASKGWNDWTQTSFNGDAARKNKFLKLMGATKSQGSGKKSLFGSLKPSASSLGSSTLNDKSQEEIQAQLQQQFEAGLALKKNQQGGKKRGLGA